MKEGFMKKKTKLPKVKKSAVIEDYDSFDVSDLIDKNKPLKFENLGLKLPEQAPTQVVSIRIPTALLNEVKAISSQRDVPYQAIIKLVLAEFVEKKRLVKI
jgi:predicted DNA binding CopG/RHH family protein